MGGRRRGWEGGGEVWEEGVCRYEGRVRGRRGGVGGSGVQVRGEGRHEGRVGEVERREKERKGKYGERKSG